MAKRLYYNGTMVRIFSTNITIAISTTKQFHSTYEGIVNLVISDCIGRWNFISWDCDIILPSCPFLQMGNHSGKFFFPIRCWNTPVFCFLPHLFCVDNNTLPTISSVWLTVHFAIFPFVLLYVRFWNSLKVICCINSTYCIMVLHSLDVASFGYIDGCYY